MTPVAAGPTDTGSATASSAGSLSGRLVATTAIAGLLLQLTSGFLLIGAIGASILASAAPPLIRAYDTASPAERSAIATTFGTISVVVQQGLWQTLEQIPALVWQAGVARLLYLSGSRALALLFGLGALVALLFAAARIGGL